MTSEADKLKAQETAKQNEEVVTLPPKVEGEEEITPENAVQKAKTFQGMLKKSQEELATLQTEKTDYHELGTKIDNLSGLVGQHGQTLDLVTEILSTSAENNEELQEKIKSRQNEQVKLAKAYAESTEARNQIKEIYEAAGMKYDDEALKPAREAWAKADSKEALRLTIVAVTEKGKIIAPPDKTPADEKDGGSAKNLKVITKSPAPGKSTEDMTSREKILAGIKESREKQD